MSAMLRRCRNLNKKNMANILTLSQATGKIHDSVRDRKRNTVTNPLSKKKRRIDYELYERCQQAWNNGENLRLNYERVHKYVFEDQWGDVIEWRNGEITEREYIQRKGNVPLQNNIMISIQNSVVGLYTKQSGEPNCFAVQKDGQWLSDMMTATMQQNWQKTQQLSMLKQAFGEYLDGGVAIARETIKEMKGQKHAWTDHISLKNAFWETGDDVRLSDLRLIGVLHEVAPGELYEKFCNKEYGWTVDEINKVFEITDTDKHRYYRSSGVQHNDKKKLSYMSFDRASDEAYCRLIEVWTKETKTRYKCYDPLAKNADEVEYRVEAKDIKHVVYENQLRIQQYQEVGVPQEDWALIEYELIEDDYWFYTFMAQDGTVIAEGETPYDFHSHPFTVSFYPYVNAEIHPFMGNIIDQQRYINRLIIMHDMAARSAAKGLTIFPLENIPDGMSKEDIAEEMTEYDGLLFFQTNKMNPNLRPEIITSGAVQIGTQELLQMELNLARDITNVSGALQGKTPSAGTSAARYAQETQNATTSLEALMNDFTIFVESIAQKKCMFIKQFYRDGRMVWDKDRTHLIEYQNMSALDVDFEVNIKESAATAAYRTYVNDQAMQLLQLGLIPVEDYLKITNLPFNDELLQTIELRKAQEAAMQQQMAMQQQLEQNPADQQQVQAAQQMLAS